MGGQEQLGKAGVCAVRAALSVPGNLQNSISTSESYSGRDSRGEGIRGGRNRKQGEEQVEDRACAD